MSKATCVNCGGCGKITVPFATWEDGEFFGASYSVEPCPDCLDAEPVSIDWSDTPDELTF